MVACVGALCFRLVCGGGRVLRSYLGCGLPRRVCDSFLSGMVSGLPLGMNIAPFCKLREGRFMANIGDVEVGLSRFLVLEGEEEKKF